jgi:hypothetical protein
MEAVFCFDLGISLLVRQQVSERRTLAKNLEVIQLIRFR